MRRVRVDIDLPENDPDRPVVDLLIKAVEEGADVKDRVDAAVILTQYLAKWKNPGRVNVARNQIKEIMRTIALDHKNPITERLRAAAVSL